MKTKSQIEHEICEAMIRFEKEYMGRGPVETQAFVVDNMVVVRLKGVLTPAEMQLVEVSDPERGCRLVKNMRIQLLEKGRPLLESVVEAVTGQKLQSLHTDISTKTGERLIIFTVPEKLPQSA